MTKKEIYAVAVRVTQRALGAWNGGSFGADYFKDKKGAGPKIVKVVYDELEPLLLTPEET